jgi:uncharacterized protein
VTFDPLFYAVAVPAVLFAGLSKGGFGSGAAFAATPLLALVLDPAQALGFMLPLLMLMDVAALRAYWRQWHVPSARFLILAGMPGVALGAALYAVADADLLRILIGVVALLFVGWRLSTAYGLIGPVRRKLGAGWGVLAGVAAGFTSFVSHAGGPPVAVYLLAQGLGKTPYQATTVITFWAINIAKAVPYALFGIFTTPLLLANLMLAPVALLGIWLGVLAHKAVPERLFFGITYVLLTVTGSKLIWDALT